MTILPFTPREETLDGAFELIDRQLYESLGMFASRHEAAEYARTVNVKRWEIWRDAELIEVH